jgi:hypothetical protein
VTEHSVHYRVPRAVGSNGEQRTPVTQLLGIHLGLILRYSDRDQSTAKAAIGRSTTGWYERIGKWAGGNNRANIGERQGASARQRLNEVAWVTVPNRVAVFPGIDLRLDASSSILLSKGGAYDDADIVPRDTAGQQIQYCLSRLCHARKPIDHR